MAFQTLIDVDSLRELSGNPRLAIVDCRFDLKDPTAGRRAYLAEHIPHARYADLDLDLAAPQGPGTGRHPLPAPDAFAAWAGAAGIGDGTQVVAYDAADGSFAARLWWLLRWLGHRAVAVLDGGLAAWIAGGGALEKGPVAAAALRFMPRPEPHSVLSTAELEAALRTPAALLVDARSPERFAGTVEPIDPVAGHIPGAVNHPLAANLGAGHHFLPAAELAARWRRRLAGKDPAQLIAMCGSGVTACHNLLSLEIAGLSGAKLYAGSWSEWIRDPKRPVARGA
ncbi:MAG TPA: sulfurtransferase [Steroidobacteraceae bacterium]|nr:sulfurtransferase [Steroidobacteraceae bacterium]